VIYRVRTGSNIVVGVDVLALEEFFACNRPLFRLDVEVLKEGDG
jgi:hypothetical protein